MFAEAKQLKPVRASHVQSLSEAREGASEAAYGSGGGSEFSCLGSRLWTRRGVIVLTFRGMRLYPDGMAGGRGWRQGGQC